MKKNEQFEIEIEDIGTSGEGIAHIDGYTVFVPFALVGERCLVHVVKVKDNMVFAKLINISSTSKDRIEPKCKYYTKCGGCVLEHAKREYELKIKRNKIETAFKKYSGVELEHVTIVDSDKCYGYRNKCAFPVRNISGTSAVCMFKGNSHIPIKIDRCELADECINQVVLIFNEYLKNFNISSYDEETNTGIVKFLVVRIVNDTPIISIVINSNKLKNINNLVERLALKFKDFSLNLNINKLNNNVIFSDKFIHIHGNKELNVNEFNINYPISSLSFMQINNFIKNEIYSKVLDIISIDDVVIDAYSGAGLLSAIIAQKAKKVYGIEIIKDATENANQLAKINEIENLTNINGDCAVQLPKLVKNLSEHNVKVVLDPPRKGCDKKVINAIIESDIKNIIYISCNPATLARDAKLLLDDGYTIKSVSGYNMFPQTEHIETLAIFVKE